MKDDFKEKKKKQAYIHIEKERIYKDRKKERQKKQTYIHIEKERI